MHERMLAVAEELLGCRLTEPYELGGSDRSTVLRASTDQSTHPTVVLKWFSRPESIVSSGGYGFVREQAGLLTIPGTPELLAVDQETGLLIMSDLGTGPSLADILLGDDPDVAWARSAEWAGSLGRLCAESQPCVEEFRTVVATLDPDSRSRGGMPSPRLPDEALVRLQEIGFGDPAAYAEELAIGGRLLDPGPRDAVVTPGDFCPDNVIFTPAGPRFLDLEGSSAHHLAMDAVYAVMPFGTCWCLFDAPPDFRSHLTTAFEDAVRSSMSATLADPDWPLLLQTAGALTVLTMTELSWDAAHRDVVPPPNFTTARQRMVARWRWAAEALTELPTLRAGFAVAAAWAERTWGTDWPRYPAFSRIPR